MSVAVVGEVRSLPLGLSRRAQLRDAPGLVALLAEDLHRGVKGGLVGVREHVGLGAPRTLQCEALLAHVDEQLGRSLGVEVAAEAERQPGVNGEAEPCELQSWSSSHRLTSLCHKAAAPLSHEIFTGLQPTA